MKKSVTALFILSLSLIFVHPTFAQDEPSNRVPAEYETVVSAVQQVMGLLQDVTQRHATEPINDQILSISDRLAMNGPVTGGFRGMPEEDLVEMLRDIEIELESISRSLERRGEDDLARRLDSVLRELSSAIQEADHDNVRIRKDSPYRYEIKNGRERVTIRTSDGDWWDDDDRWEEKHGGRDERWRDRRDDWSDSWNGGSSDWVTSSESVLGEWNHRWPFQQYSLYRNIPSFRYNRVEGLFLGVTRAPLDWSSWDRGRIYGQGGYAFAMKKWQYKVGAETRFGDRQRNQEVDLKIGGAYQRNTDTDDLWKASWAENTAAASLFRHDFFDYHGTEGWTAYAVARLTRFAQLSAGYRDEEYSSLRNETNWSLFGGSDFRPNPGVNEGQMKSFVLSFEGGSIRSLQSRPRGAAFRLEAELGQGLGGDFDFSRYLGDVRTYARLTRNAGLSLRFRGGFTEGTVPVQKAFTLGGIGSVRGYEQNEFIGTRMMLANAELSLYEPDLMDWILDDITLFGTFDAGWTNLQAGQDAFDMNDVIPSAGFGLAFDDRLVRIEVAWPLRDLGTGLEPSVWFRINPTF